jgi:hypothetical protein
LTRNRKKASGVEFTNSIHETGIHHKCDIFQETQIHIAIKFSLLHNGHCFGLP